MYLVHLRVKKEKRLLPAIKKEPAEVEFTSPKYENTQLEPADGKKKCVCVCVCGLISNIYTTTSFIFSRNTARKCRTKKTG